MNIKSETLEITEETYTMQLDINKLNSPMLGGSVVKINPFGSGELSSKIDAANVPALLERAAAEVFPMFVEFQKSIESGKANFKLHAELSNVRWSI